MRSSASPGGCRPLWRPLRTSHRRCSSGCSRPRGFQPSDTAPGELVFAPGTPRDFTVDDATLHLREPRIFINGRLDESSARMLGDETGSVVWIYVANRGRFLLSVVPNARFGFRRAGEIRGSSLRFTVGADTYSVSTAGRIAPGDAAFNLYVLHQPTWRRPIPTPTSPPRPRAPPTGWTT